MDHKILSKETIENVKNRPSFKEAAAPSINNYVYESDLKERLIYEHNKKIEDFVLFCLLELGYKGKREIQEVHEYILDNNIELIYTPVSELESFIYTIRCKQKNYEKKRVFRFRL